ncbi:MAG: winged helix-turn-helix transcriptional regulator [Bacteroidales bacterium]|nr:winged helix-turn-helix transcriptional regulator [Bacteroidales bacterium]
MKEVFFVTELLIHPDFPIDENEGGSIGGEIELTKRQKEILDIIKVNNKISYRTIAEKLEINESAVLKHINALKEKGVIQRVGGTRGHWEVCLNFPID